MTNDLSQRSSSWHSAVRHVAAALGTLLAAAIVVLFAWNSFAVTVLGAEALQFKEALGLTLLVAIAGRLFAPRRHGHARLES